MGGVPFGWVVGNKWYVRCYRCGRVVRVNKPILGDLHLCVYEEKKS